MIGYDFQPLLDFWFGDVCRHPKHLKSHEKIWFGKDPGVDRYIATIYVGLLELARLDRLDDWRQTPAGWLALVILLDQLPRNMFRGSLAAFASDHLALQWARLGVRREIDRQLHPIERTFFYLPFEHSEQLADQEVSLGLFNELLNETPPPWLPYVVSTCDFAWRHYQIIQRFGRFPHRNQALRRQSSAAEIAFLKTPGSSF